MAHDSSLYACNTMNVILTHVCSVILIVKWFFVYVCHFGLQVKLMWQVPLTHVTSHLHCSVIFKLHDGMSRQIIYRCSSKHHLYNFQFFVPTLFLPFHGRPTGLRSAITLSSSADCAELHSPIGRDRRVTYWGGRLLGWQKSPSEIVDNMRLQIRQLKVLQFLLAMKLLQDVDVCKTVCRGMDVCLWSTSIFNDKGCFFWVDTHEHTIACILSFIRLNAAAGIHDI